MCGVFFAERRDGLPLDEAAVRIATTLIETRGPEKTVSKWSSNRSRFIANAILPVGIRVGKDSSDNSVTSADGFAFNGEVYGFPTRAEVLSTDMVDTDLMFRLILGRRFREVTELEGFYSFVYRPNFDLAGESIYIGTDLIGEKSLFVHLGGSYTVVGSTAEAVAAFLVAVGVRLTPNNEAVTAYLCSRNMLEGAGSFINEVSKIEPGRIFQINEEATIPIQLTPDPLDLVSDEILELDLHWRSNLIREEIELSFTNLESSDISSTFSGGVDSSLVSGMLVGYFGKPDVPLITLDYGEKDPSAGLAPHLAAELGSTQHIFHPVSLEEFVEHHRTVLGAFCSPLPTHSIISASIVANLARETGTRIIFTGAGADEIFRGYSAYCGIKNRESSISLSPYSYFSVPNFLVGYLPEEEIRRQQEISDITKIAGVFSALGFREPQASTMASQWLDISLNLSSVELYTNDYIFGRYGLESRTPYVSKSMVALGVGSHDLQRAPSWNSDKAKLRSMFFEQFGHHAPKQKFGFSGFPNESATLLLRGSQRAWRLESFLGYQLPAFESPEISRREQWKLQNLELFFAELEKFSVHYFLNIIESRKS